MKSITVQTKKAWPLVMGVDVSPSSLKYVIVSRKGKQIEIAGFGRQSLPDTDTPAVREIWRRINERFLKKNGLSGKPAVVVGIEGSGIVMKKESLPSLSRKELMQTLQFSMQNEIVTDENTTILVDYEKLDSAEAGKENVQYLTLGINEQTVLQRLQPLIQEGTLPAKVTPVIKALGNLVKLIPDLAGKRRVALLDIGTQRSMLVIFRSGKLDFYREIMVGGSDFTRAITGVIFHEGKAIQYSLEEAEMFKTRFGYPLGFTEGMSFRGAPLSEVGTMMRPVVERLTGEIDRSINFYKEQPDGGDIEGLYVLGGGAQLMHLTEVLSERIKLPVETLPLIPGIKSRDLKGIKSFKKHYLEQAVSLALALEEQDSINLLPESLARKLKERTSVKNLTTIAVAVAAILLIFTINFYSSIDSVGFRVSNLQQRVDKIEDTGRIFASLMKEKSVVEGQLVNLNSYLGQDRQFVQVLRAVSHAIPAKLTLTYLKYGREGEDAKSRKTRGTDEKDQKPLILQMRGISRKPPSDLGIFIAHFMAELEKSGYFSEVKFEKGVSNAEDEEYWFEIIGILSNGQESSKE